MFREAFEESGNPYFAWRAIHRCIKANTPFPKWLIAYLAECSERMFSGKAEQTCDLRKILPWVLGFPMQRGPGYLLRPGLRPGYDSKTLEFIIKFARLIIQGQHPVTARRDACNAVFDGKDAEVDDKTLGRWVLDAFGLQKAPKSTKQWKEVARRNLAYILAASALLRSAATKAEIDEFIALVKQIPELTALAKQIPEELTESRETLSCARAWHVASFLLPTTEIYGSRSDNQCQQTDSTTSSHRGGSLSASPATAPNAKPPKN